MRSMRGGLNRKKEWPSRSGMKMLACLREKENQR